MKRSSGKAVFLVILLILMLACQLPSTTDRFGSGSAGRSVYLLSTTSPMREYTVLGTVNVRTCTSTTCKVIGILPKGQVVEGICGSGNWCQIKYRERNAWVYAPCLMNEKGTCR